MEAIATAQNFITDKIESTQQLPLVLRQNPMGTVALGFIFLYLTYHWVFPKQYVTVTEKDQKLENCNTFIYLFILLFILFSLALYTGLLQVNNISR